MWGWGGNREDGTQSAPQEIHSNFWLNKILKQSKQILYDKHAAGNILPLTLRCSFGLYMQVHVDTEPAQDGKSTTLVVKPDLAADGSTVAVTLSLVGGVFKNTSLTCQMPMAFMTVRVGNGLHVG